MTTVHRQAIAALCYRVAEIYGHRHPVAVALRQAAMLGTEEAGAAAWDALFLLPEQDRRDLATWFSRVNAPDRPAEPTPDWHLAAANKGEV